MAGIIGWVKGRLTRGPRAPEPERYLVRGACALLDQRADVIARARCRLEVTVPAEPGRPQTWKGVLTEVDRPDDLERRFYGVNRSMGLRLEGAGLGEVMVVAFTGPAGPEREYVIQGYGPPPVELPPPEQEPPATTSS